MKVAVLCFGAFRDYLPDEAEGNRWSTEVPEGSTVGDVVDVLGGHPHRDVARGDHHPLAREVPEVGRGAVGTIRADRLSGARRT